MPVGRRSTPGAIPDVETLECPARWETVGESLPHEIENRGAKPAACRWCDVSWGDLDALVRATPAAQRRARIASPA